MVMLRRWPRYFICAYSYSSQAHAWLSATLLIGSLIVWTEEPVKLQSSSGDATTCTLSQHTLSQHEKVGWHSAVSVYSASSGEHDQRK